MTNLEWIRSLSAEKLGRFLLEFDNVDLPTIIGFPVEDITKCEKCSCFHPDDYFDSDYGRWCWNGGDCSNLNGWEERATKWLNTEREEC